MDVRGQARRALLLASAGSSRVAAISMSFVDVRSLSIPMKLEGNPRNGVGNPPDSGMPTPASLPESVALLALADLLHRRRPGEVAKRIRNLLYHFVTAVDVVALRQIPGRVIREPNLPPLILPNQRFLRKIDTSALAALHQSRAYLRISENDHFCGAQLFPDFFCPCCMIDPCKYGHSR